MLAGAGSKSVRPDFARTIRNGIGQWPNRNSSDTTFRTDGSIWPVSSLARGQRVGSATSREDIGNWRVSCKASRSLLVARKNMFYGSSSASGQGTNPLSRESAARKVVLEEGLSRLR